MARYWIHGAWLVITVTLESWEDFTPAFAETISELLTRKDDNESR